MDEDDFDLVITPDDGPLTCIWKVIYGKGWMSVTEIVKALKHYHYSDITIRTRLSTLPRDVVLQRQVPGKGGRGHSTEYFAIEGVKMPPDYARGSKKRKSSTEDKFSLDSFLHASKFF